MTDSFAIKSDSSGFADQMLIIEKYANTTQSVHSDERFIRKIADRTSNDLGLDTTIAFDDFSEIIFKRPSSRKPNFTYHGFLFAQEARYDENSFHMTDLEMKFKPHDINSVKQSLVQIHSMEPVTKAHRVMWLFLVTVSLIWGTIAGIALATGFGPYPGVAITGLLGIFVLSLTLFRLGRARTLDER